MTKAPHSKVCFATTSLAALMLASCAVPPRQAWQEIQTRGLITYLSNDSKPLGVNSTSQVVAQNNAATQLASSTALVGPDRPSTPPPSMLNASTMPVAQAVPDLPGYVRTPFTNPPRLVDVRGMSAGSKVVCPYTQRPFLVPGGVSASSASLASTGSDRTKPSTSERPRTAPVPNSNVAAMTNPAPSAPTQPKVTPAPSASVELPYGSPIAGRPGFVNSPYAAKHQLVDVTGLPVGMEVKCPYTGKLFRVPAQ
jgi:uncharacterized Zn-finger protein